MRESDGKAAGKFKKDGKTADWSYLEYGVCIRFLEEHIHQIAIGFFVPVLFFRKQAAHMRLPASAAGGAKSLLLSGVVRLRSHPLLRGVAQRVPQHWQTRAKNWLRA